MANVARTDQKQRIIIGIDNTYEQILAFDQDATIQVDWDYRAFRKLPPDIQEKLSVETLKRYALAEAKYEAREREENKTKRISNPLGNTTGYYAAKNKIRERKGYHQYWAKAGEDFERCMATVYTQVRRPSAKQVKDGYEPGEEEGPVLEQKTSQGIVEMIAVECPMEAYQQYLEWMSQESTRRFKNVENDFGQATEGLNRTLPRGSRITPGNVDEDSGTFRPL